MCVCFHTLITQLKSSKIKGNIGLCCYIFLTFLTINIGSSEFEIMRVECNQIRRGGSNEYTQSMFLSRNKKNNLYPCKPQCYYIKWGLKGSKLYRHVFMMIENKA